MLYQYILTGVIPNIWLLCISMDYTKVNRIVNECNAAYADTDSNLQELMSQRFICKLTAQSLEYIFVVFSPILFHNKFQDIKKVERILQ